MRIAQTVLMCSVVGAILVFCLSACVGMAADRLDTFVGTKFTNPDPRDTTRNAQTKNLYTRMGSNDSFIYKEERVGLSRRVYISFFKHCRYSLLIDENDIIQSWRDEGGPVHMRDCKFS
ncbi:hypothetical protein [Curvibacter delicatus]|uniref:hypothetical protein n=1 Tax=Curvibacter delicatus TaxID=80879 RepID=UPI000AAFEFDD|nr:hypothetical protein [Curvibacter delicatus]